jgi:hypothetical protein
MYYTIQHALSNILTRIVPSDSPLQRNAPFVTGPHALNKGFQSFMADKGISIADAGVGKKPARAGLWIGTDDRSIRVVGIGENENEYVIREFIRRSKKLKDYKKMNMQHFLQPNSQQQQHEDYDNSSQVYFPKSCLHQIYDKFQRGPNRN